MEEIFEAIAPHLLELFMALVTLATGYATLKLRQLTGVELDAKHRESLHSAIRTGVTVMLERGASGEVLKEGVKQYVKDSVPDAIKALLPGESVLENLIAAKAAEYLKGK